jgi:PAS domain S-box-containing protein
MNMADQEQRHFALLDSVPLGICVLRRDYTVCFWNTCLEDWTGLSRETIIGQDIGSFFPHLHEPKYRCRLETIFQGGAPAIFSSQLHKHIFPSPLPNGTLRVQHTTVTSVSAFQDESHHHALISVEDVTELTKRMHEYRAMSDRVTQEMRKVENAMAEVRVLSGLLPICSHCKSIRDDKGYWNRIEMYLRTHSEVQFTHSICPDCVKSFFPDFYESTALKTPAASNPRPKTDQ